MTRRRGMTEEAADASIDQACRMLRLPTIRQGFADGADRAVAEQMSYRGFLAELLLAECDDRARRRSERRIKAAKFPHEKSLRAFDFDANPNIDPATIHTLAQCDWVKKGQPLCLIGDSGTVVVGASGVIFGYLGLLLARGLVERSWWNFAVALFIGLLYWYQLFNVLPTDQRISWQGHLLGLVGGVLAAIIFRRR